MWWLSFETWIAAGGRFFTANRYLYKGYKWTPFVKLSKRYSTWFGYFNAKHK